MLAQYGLYIWTEDPLTDDILAFVLKRLGYIAKIIRTKAHWNLQRDLSFTGPNILIFGPEITTTEALGACRLFPNTSAVFLYDTAATSMFQELPEDAFRVAVPVDLVVLREILETIIARKQAA